MKRIYLILFIAVTAFTATSCKEKTPSEKFKDKMEDAGGDIKDATKDAGDATEHEAKKAKEKVEEVGK
jgi:hypothetical protein